MPTPASPPRFPPAAPPSPRLSALALALALLASTLLLGGCSLRQIAAEQMADALAGSGAVFASDNDPQLVREAAPFSLKLMESVLEQTPRHRGLLLAAAAGFTQYAYAFVQQDADLLESRDIDASNALRRRARNLYLRARDYGLRSLEARHRGLGAALRDDAPAAAARLGRDDVPGLYWTAVAWAGAIANSKDDPDLIADLPLVEALIDRAAALDPTYDDGAILVFLITYETVRPAAATPADVRSRTQYERARALSQGRSAAPMVALAEAVCVQNQDRAGFEALLHEALQIDPDADPPRRLVNLIMQQRARWLLQRVEELFIE